MKPIPIFLAALAVMAGAAFAAESGEKLPQLPDPDYCSRRDADPRKCVIQDGPPPRDPFVRKKPAPPQPPAPPAPEMPAAKSPGIITR